MVEPPEVDAADNVTVEEPSCAAVRSSWFVPFVLTYGPDETKAPVLSEKYHVDVLWKDIEEVDEEGNVSVDHPYGWKSYAIDIDNEGMHGFMGVSYIENKM